MPDILIRMDMPENCLFCPCSFWDQRTLGLWCHALSTYDDNLVAENVTAFEAHCGKTTKAKRPEWCPLVELPPHGDLVDATQYRDEFMDGVYNMCADDPDNNRANVIIDLYDCAPVIVPAERRESND